jgi:hypothetical protein
MHAGMKVIAIGALLSLCDTARATSIVVLANKTEIAVAADSKAKTIDGLSLPDNCKILRHGNLFFVMAGTVSKGTISSTDYNAMDIFVRASRDSSDLEQIDRRFDQLIAGPLQHQIDYDFAHNRNSFREQMRFEESQVLQVVMFEMTRSGPYMVGSYFPITFPGKKSAKIGNPYHKLCKEGVGDCYLVLGEEDAIQKYVKDHPISGDLAAQAEKFVRLEVLDQPENVGGRIAVVLINSTGLYRRDSRNPCPREWRKQPFSRPIR